MAVEQRIAAGTPTSALVSEGGHMTATGQYTAERQAVQDAIIEKVFSPEAIAAATPAPGVAPTLSILGGRGGSGKSFVTGPNGPVDKATAILLDSDAFKAALPEYQGWNAAHLHEEASSMLNAADKIAAKLGVNVIHDSTMKSADNIASRTAQFVKAGYTVNGYYVYASPTEAASRALGRFTRGGSTGRFVPPSVILANTENEKNFDAMKPTFTRWAVYDNMGSSPRLAASGGKRK